MVVKAAEIKSIENEFRALAQRWKDECAFLASTSAMVAHPASPGGH